MCFHSYILRHSNEVQRLFFPTDLNAERTRNLKSNLTQFTFLIPVSDLIGNYSLVCFILDIKKVF